MNKISVGILLKFLHHLRSPAILVMLVPLAMVMSVMMSVSPPAG